MGSAEEILTTIAAVDNPKMAAAKMREATAKRAGTKPQFAKAFNILLPWETELPAKRIFNGSTPVSIELVDKAGKIVDQTSNITLDVIINRQKRPDKTGK